MIFTKEHVLLIQQGRKTQTRRFKRPRVVVGRIYAIQTQYYKKENLGRILIHSVYRERLGECTERDARRLGYASRSDYFRAFAGIHGHMPDRRRSVWVTNFSYCR